jgi:glycosyltransferase involved in cell wall biosynthesis
MRILHLASYGNPAAGGFVPMIAALSARVRARGDTFGLVVPEVAGSAWHDAVRASGTELHVVAGAREAAALARAWRPDIAHVHFFGWEPAITLALAASRTRLFWHAHSTSVVRGRVRRSLRSLVKYRGFGARVERFVTVSATTAGELAVLGAAPGRIVVVRNEVDMRRFRAPKRTEREAARAALGLDGPTLLFFGRDPYLKGADLLAQALARTAGVTVLAVGTPAAARAALAAAAARVVAVERADDVVPLLWAADAVAVPSRAEGFALVLLEAVSTGLPAAASDLPALREAANGAGAVTFVAAEDAGALGAALRAALGSERALSEAPPQAFGGGNGLERWARGITALYDRE